MPSINLVRKRVFGGLLGLLLVAAWAPPSRAAPTGAQFEQSETPRTTSAAALPLDHPAACVPREQCCKLCSKGKACGNTCIRADYNCHKGRGCACDAEDVCE